MSKSRLTVTVDEEALAAARDAVSGGEADSLSSWVNAALIEKAVRDRRVTALRAAIADYEAEHGQISDEEIAVQRRSDRATAIVVRGRNANSGVA